VAALLLCGVSLAAPTAGGEMPLNAGGGSDAAGLEEELRVGAAELAAVPAESRALFAKVLGRLEGMRGELEELKAGKARSDARFAQHEYGRPSWRARRVRTRRKGRRQRRPSWKTTHSRVGLGSPPRPGGGASLRARAGLLGAECGGDGRLLRGQAEASHMAPDVAAPETAAPESPEALT
jgi:hypothetical protein